MCNVCKEVKGIPAVDALQLIGAAMKGGSRKEQEHLLDLADSISAPFADDDMDGLPPEDEELALAWETERRQNDE